MAANFRISTRKDADGIHLRLQGDFDGSSAYELLNVLKSRCRGISRVFIHTGRLRSVHPFGLGVFGSNLDFLKNRAVRVVYCGRHAAEISPGVRP
ncbi:MAG: anti-sigma factor antagonist [Deltaproteobacteria bacterium]|nr:anti-sigma factor antagonist [Deltaproteobacteria bacterium]MBW1923819.1 anti-sigma factor antagonist [Deltaproteobacteria bacterium]MBW1948536.1 anti-sigma factor antagonist [Deltaproteobacteria bacterium]MBW2006964.1 anti-sigma factor antagonist [Deltaproteobacteria bacterium]MBW2103190.1 anti-sigma factor antagonist [Deltaproteobacteria bacterium]